VIDRVVCVGGPPGSGKSTAARLLADRLSLGYVSAGEIFRAEAERHHMDLVAFSRFAESHEEFDREIDRRMLEQATRGHILDARLAGALCRRSAIPAYSLRVTAAEEVRAQRLATRDGVPLPRARSDLRAREASERARYLRLYQIDVDHETADFTIDSSELSPAEVAARLLSHLDPSAMTSSQ
jgi:CMP/dCMP kinase